MDRDNIIDSPDNSKNHALEGKFRGPTASFSPHNLTTFRGALKFDPNCDNLTCSG